METLQNSHVGKTYVIKSLSFSRPEVARRLLELGFTPGQKVKLERKSLSGQTLLIEIRGYLLSMRSTVAKFVLCEEL